MSRPAPAVKCREGLQTQWERYQTHNISHGSRNIYLTATARARGRNHTHISPPQRACAMRKNPQGRAEHPARRTSASPGWSPARSAPPLRRSAGCSSKASCASACSVGEAVGQRGRRAAQQAQQLAERRAAHERLRALATQGESRLQGFLGTQLAKQLAEQRAARATRHSFLCSHMGTPEALEKVFTPSSTSHATCQFQIRYAPVSEPHKMLRDSQITNHACTLDPNVARLQNAAHEAQVASVDPAARHSGRTAASTPALSSSAGVPAPCAACSG